MNIQCKWEFFMNLLTIAGHLGADPEVRFTTTGQKVITLRVATKSRKKGSDVTIWWRVTIWGEQFDKMMPYLKKGSSIIVVGEFHQPEIFTDKEGKPQISLSMTASNLIFSPFGRNERSNEENVEKNQANSNVENDVFAAYATGQKSSKENEFNTNLEDEIPF